MEASCLFAYLIVGIATAPNNMDSLSYHLPRIMQWLQQHHIGMFATPYLAQVYLPSTAEMGDLALYAIFGTDRAMFLNQWSAALLLALASASIMKAWGRPRDLQLLAALFVTAAPMVAGQASTTQVDLIEASLIVAALAIWIQQRDAISMLLVGSGMAIAISVKPLAALFLLPLAISLIIWAVRHVRRQTFAAITMVAIICVTSNLGWTFRNLEYFHSPTGPNMGLTVESDFAQSMLSNSIKNLSLNFAVPGPEAANKLLSSAMTRTSETMARVSVDDPRFSYTDFDVDSQRNEDRAANVLQGAIALGGLIVMFATRRPPRGMRLIGWSAVVGWLTFASFVKYQTFSGRFIIPLWALPGLAGLWVIGNISKDSQRKMVVLLLGLTIIFQGMPWIVAQKWRPLIGASSVLETNSWHDLTVSMPSEESQRMANTVAFIRSKASEDCTIALTGDFSYALEYIWWRELPQCKIGHIHVNNSTSDLEWASRATFVISTDGKIKKISGYELPRIDDALTIFVRQH